MADLYKLWGKQCYGKNIRYEDWCERELQRRLDAEESAPSASDNTQSTAIAQIADDMEKESAVFLKNNNAAASIIIDGWVRQPRAL